MKKLLISIFSLAYFSGLSQAEHCDVPLALDDRPRLRREIAEPIITGIYPNPVISTLNVRLAKPSTIRLFSSIGQRVYSERAWQSKTINVSYLAQGMYLLEVSNEESKTTYKIFISK